ncbi:MAG: universal stress protein [Betaproteobacteria bacterium]|nr:universal stress protein [Betaproteobacteria bacterium]
MYRHILIPSDGSELAEKAVEAGLQFAHSIGARVTGFIAVPEYKAPSHGELMSGSAVSLAEYDRRVKVRAEEVLQKVMARARALSVECATDYVQSDRPYEAIIRAAEVHGCDLIFMASHGRRGISALVHGSETQGVLTHSRIPTLVYR